MMRATCPLKPWEWLRYLGSQCKERSAWFLEGRKAAEQVAGRLQISRKREASFIITRRRVTHAYQWKEVCRSGWHVGEIVPV